MNTENIIKTDIIIIGAGLVGLTTALALARLGHNIVIIDQGDFKTMHEKGADGRTCAISAGSAQFFEEIGVWQDLKPHAGPILDILVTDSGSKAYLHYDHKLISKQLNSGPMGYIIENYHLRNFLYEHLLKYKNVEIIAPALYEELKFNADNISINISEKLGSANDNIDISRNKRCYQAALLIAADGKNSNIRKLANIKSFRYDYNQIGIVATIWHEKPHQQIAREIFLPSGPFAVLPMLDVNLSSLVWTESADVAGIYLKMPQEEQEEYIKSKIYQKQFTDYLGNISIKSQVYSYRLELCKASRYSLKNSENSGLILVGDAAHAMHPLAGQGFNAGIRDVSCLYNLLKNHKQHEHKEGATPPVLLSKIFSDYQKNRSVDSIALIGITDILNRGFLNQLLPVKLARRSLMRLVNNAGFLKSFFMKHAAR